MERMMYTIVFNKDHNKDHHIREVITQITQQNYSYLAGSPNEDGLHVIDFKLFEGESIEFLNPYREWFDSFVIELL